MRVLQRNGLSLEEWTINQTRDRYPQIYLDDIKTVFWEKEAGYLMLEEPVSTWWKNW